MGEDDRLAACESLKAWFISQDIDPHEGMMTMCMFQAWMILENDTGPGNADRKLALIDETIRAYIALGAMRR